GMARFRQESCRINPRGTRSIHLPSTCPENRQHVKGVGRRREPKCVATVPRLVRSWGPGAARDPSARVGPAETRPAGARGGSVLRANAPSSVTPEKARTCGIYSAAESYPQVLMQQVLMDFDAFALRTHVTPTLTITL